MIRTVSSSLPTFKTLTFTPGLNLLLADVAKTSTDRHTRNSAGKTSLVEIIHFRRWCTWRLEVEIAPNLRLLCDDRLATDGIWASGRQHPVQHRHADGGLGLLGCEAAGPQARSDQRLVATHCRFY